MASPTGRRKLATALAAGAAAITAGLFGSATAAAAPPNCTAGDLAGIASGVAASTSAYLFTHPELNNFFTSLQGRPHEEVPEATRVYFDAHPQEHAELKGIRQPLVDFRARCGLPETNMPMGQ